MTQTSRKNQSENADLAELNLPRFSAPYDWQAIDAIIKNSGGVIMNGLLNESELGELNDQIDAHLNEGRKVGKADSGSDQYNRFLGHKTLRLHGLLEKVAFSESLIGHPQVVDWASRTLSAKSNNILLNAGELIQIQPGEPSQYVHRDTDSWPVALEHDPIIVNAIFALDDFTEENGATYVAPGSWRWKKGRRALPTEFTRAVMSKGDALLFRGDLLHGGGENTSKARRRAISISYCAGWLRPVENSYLNLQRETVLRLPKLIQALVGYAAYDGSNHNGGIVGLYENGDPNRYLESPLEQRS